MAGLKVRKEEIEEVIEGRNILISIVVVLVTDFSLIQNLPLCKYGWSGDVKCLKTSKKNNFKKEITKHTFYEGIYLSLLFKNRISVSVTINKLSSYSVFLLRI